MAIPGLQVVFPSTAVDAKGLMKAAIRSTCPVIFLEHVRLYRNQSEIPAEVEALPLGQAAVRRQGHDVTVVAIGSAVEDALIAAETLEKESISLEVIDPRTLVPLDKGTIIKSVMRTRRLVVVDEAHDTCSAASHIAAIIDESLHTTLLTPIRRLVVPDVNIPFSSGLAFEKLVPVAAKIVDCIRAML
jgi:pyruvate dehydrogenase E1 component beta subunit